MPTKNELLKQLKILANRMIRHYDRAAKNAGISKKKAK